MTFPILPAHELGLVLAVLIGFGFGFVLERAGFGRANKLAAQFYGHDMTVFKVMFSAIVTAMLGVVLASAVGLADFKALADHATSSTFLVPMIAGGFLLGAGFIVSGYCPGTSFVAMASGKLDGLMTVLGVIVGQVIWAELEWRPGFATFHNAGGLGNLYLWELFGLPASSGPYIVAVAVTVMAVGCFVGAEKLERVLSGRANPSAGRDAGGAARALRVRRPRHRRRARPRRPRPARPERGRRRARRPPSPRSRSPGACSTSPGSSASSISGRSRRARRSGSRAPSARRAEKLGALGLARRDGATRPRARRGRAAHRDAGGGRRVPRPRVRARGRLGGVGGVRPRSPGAAPAGAPAADLEAYRVRAGIHAAMTGMKAAPPPPAPDRRAGRAARSGRLRRADRCRRVLRPDV